MSRAEAEARIRRLSDEFAAEVRRIYAEAEYHLIEVVARRIERGIDTSSGLGWAERKLAEIQALNKEIGNQIADLRKLDPKIEEAVTAAYNAGADRAAAELIKAKLTDLFADISVSRGTAVKTLAKAIVDALESSHLGILRMTQDAYRKIISEAAGKTLSGAMTRRQAAQQALSRFADKGISGFIDKAGRRWDIASYAETATRSATAQAAIQGHVDKLSGSGHDLVIISDSPEECELCRPWEGKICSISGGDPKYPSLDTAIAEGLFHANCTHRTHLYVEGLTRPYTNTENPEGYKEREQQRYIERGVRRWKNRQAAAITDDEKRLAGAKVKEWQSKMRGFIGDTGRRRDYDRESITRGR
ncbi:phage minor capsid protein [Candidatus Pacearchaeota archaeon]|nr:phage minor capsid protein [Candidatus Pacearchaeota archaeon]